MKLCAIISAVLVAITFSSRVPSAFGQPAVITATFTNNNSGTVAWNDPANWSSNPNWPTGEGAGAIFNAATASAAASPSRSISMSSPVVVGSIVFNLDQNNASGVNYDSRFINGTGGSLTFDAAGSGPATFDVTGPGNTRLSLEGGGASAITLTDNLIVTVSNTAYTGTTGALNVESTITGPGGITKEGAGTMTLSSNDKTYTGPTVLNGGRVRLSQAAALSTTSFTINNNAHLEQISDGDYALGTGTLFLNGTGISNSGAIRPSRTTTSGRKLTITNPVELVGTSLIHSQTQVGSTSFGDGRITLSGVVTGSGTLQLTAPQHDQFLGTYHLTGANTYSGGTELYGGRLIVGDLAAGFPTATLGTGNVTVFNSRAPFGIEVNPEARALLTIPTGVLDAINDTATLTIGGGFTASSAQAGAVELQADIDETVGALVLGNTTYSAIGTYGSTASGADFTFDEFFSGLGVVRIDASAGLSGDYNNDGTVDAADYVLWRKNPAAFGGPGGYTTWSQNFGEGGSGSGSGAVPEPSALLLAIGAVLCLLACRRASPRTLAWELVRNRSY